MSPQIIKGRGARLVSQISKGSFFVQRLASGKEKKKLTLIYLLVINTDIDLFKLSQVSLIWSQLIDKYLKQIFYGEQSPSSSMYRGLTPYISHVFGILYFDYSPLLDWFFFFYGQMNDYTAEYSFHWNKYCFHEANRKCLHFVIFLFSLYIDFFFQLLCTRWEWPTTNTRACTMDDGNMMIL